MRAILILTLGLSITYCSPEHRHGDIAPATTTDTTEGTKGGGDTVAVDDDRIAFSEVVARVLEPTGCFDCHGKFKNFADISKRIVPGSPEQSRLFVRASTDMPPIEEGYLPLSEEQIALLRDWIAQGARTE